MPFSLALFLYFFVFVFSSILTLAIINTIVDGIASYKKINRKFLMGSLLFLLVLITGNILIIYAFVTGGCKLEGYEYVKIEKFNGIKAFTYNNKIYTIDQKIDINECQIKITKYSPQTLYFIQYEPGEINYTVEKIDQQKTNLEKEKENK